MWLKPDPKSPISISAQIREGILAAIASQRYRSGEKLPSVRGLAAEILVNPNTVAKVYRDLERDGLIETRPGSGVTVAEAAPELAGRELRTELEGRARDLVEQAERSGLQAHELLGLLEVILLESGAALTKGAIR